jgi:RNA polymerase-interacting CarD/CdnL/TRCF family regulator
MVNERPVIFLGKTNNLASALQQDGSAQTDQWKYQMKVTAHRWTNQLKADMLHVVENLFESAKDKAINWGEEKLNNILG